MFYGLRRFNKGLTTFQLCEPCFKHNPNRLRQVTRAVTRNGQTDDPKELIDITTWHKLTMADLDGTCYDLNCMMGCGAYEPNPDPRYDEEEEMLLDNIMPMPGEIVFGDGPEREQIPRPVYFNVERPEPRNVRGEDGAMYDFIRANMVDPRARVRRG